MQSKLDNVDDYLKTVPEDRRKALILLRDLCVGSLTGFEETMALLQEKRRGGSVVHESEKFYRFLYLAKGCFGQIPRQNERNKHWKRMHPVHKR